MKIFVFLGILLLAHTSYCQVGEKCRTDAYPPDKKDTVPTEVVNLDLAPEQRWHDVVASRKDGIQNLVNQIKKLVSEKVVNLVDGLFAHFIGKLPAEYGNEIRGVATSTGVPLGEIILYNVFYEIFSVCTSIVAEDPSGKLFHVRNMDFGLLMGWDTVNDTWSVTEALRPLVVNIEYQSKGKTIYKSAQLAGYVGLLTAIKQGKFTLTINERFALKGGYLGLFEWFLGLAQGQFNGFFLRDVLLKANSYEEAKSLLSNTPLIAPAYFILGGNKSGEGCVITRALDSVLNTMSLNPTNKTWYVLETNYDNWKKPMVIDDRRTPAKKCMTEMTQKSVGFKGLFNVLSTKPVLNKLTAYTALMQVDSGELETYRRTCENPCYPW